jgi:hypothetical protein
MKPGALRLAAVACLVLAVRIMSSLVAAAESQVPRPPADLELVAGSDSSITISWAQSSGATSYNIYRGTSSGSEGGALIATTTDTMYTDPNLSPQPVYFYQLTAVNAAGESAPSEEDASRTPPPVGTGGDVAGMASGTSLVYNAEDALLDGFDWFQMQNGWFPQVLYSSGSISPGQLVTDMAYSSRGTLTFHNVVAPTSGLYTVNWRYAFDWGLFPGVTNRQMGLRVNGDTITTTQRFIITGSFDVYRASSLQVNLNAGVNSISLFVVSNHGVPRVDQNTCQRFRSKRPHEPDGNRDVVPFRHNPVVDPERQRQPELVQRLSRPHVRRGGDHAHGHHYRRNHVVHRHRRSRWIDLFLRRRGQQQCRRLPQLERGLAHARLLIPGRYRQRLRLQRPWLSRRIRSHGMKWVNTARRRRRRRGDLSRSRYGRHLSMNVSLAMQAMVLCPDALYLPPKFLAEPNSGTLNECGPDETCPCESALPGGRACC